MPKWEITQTVDYWAEGIEADTAEEAFAIYLQDQDNYYNGTVSEKITEMDEEDDFKRLYTAIVDIDRQLGKANWARSIQSPV